MSTREKVKALNLGLDPIWSKGGGQVAKTINLRDVSEDLHLRAKVQATKEGLSLKALVIRLLEEYLKKVGG